MYSTAAVGEIVVARGAANAVATKSTGKADTVATSASNVVMGTPENKTPNEAARRRRLGPQKVDQRIKKINDATRTGMSL